MVRLALPVVAIQVGMMSMGVVDTLMVGRLSARALAAVALGNLYFFLIAVFGMGTLMVLDPVVAQAVGARDPEGAARGVQRGILLAGLLALPAAVLLLLAEPFMLHAGQPAEVVPFAADYAERLAPGVFPFFLFVVLRQTLQSMRVTRPIVVAIVLANLANAALNWMLIFGHAGAPALGVAGSAWATTISRWLLAGLLFAMAWRALAPLMFPFRREVWRTAPLARMLRLGLPIGAQVFLEFGAFALVALMMGWLGTRSMAGAELRVQAFVALWPLVLGAALLRMLGVYGGARVGAAWGGAEPVVRRYAWMGLVSQAGVALGLATIVADRLPRIGVAMQTLIVGVIAFNESVGSVVFRRGLELAGEIRE